MDKGGDNSKFHISLIHKHSDSYGYIDVLWTREEITLNSIYHSYTNIQTVMDILMCCGQGEDNSKFHIYHSYTNIQTVMYILMCCGQGEDNSEFHISLIHKHSDSDGYIHVLCGQGGDNSKFHISLISPK